MVDGFSDALIAHRDEVKGLWHFHQLLREENGRGISVPYTLLQYIEPLRDQISDFHNDSLCLVLSKAMQVIV